MDITENILSKALGCRELARKDCWQLLQGWREVYARDLFSQIGKWKDGDFDWHLFSAGHYPCEAGAKALECYRERNTSGDILIFVFDPEEKCFRCEFTERPEFHDEDVIVTPPDYEWTMVFTHEQSWGYGPYFARRER